MGLRHKVTINVTDPYGLNSTILKGAQMKLPSRIARFLFGDFTQVYLLKPDQTIESVDIKETTNGGKVNEQDRVTT